MNKLVDCLIKRLVKYQVMNHLIAKYSIYLKRQGLFIEDAEISFIRKKVKSLILGVTTLLVSLTFLKGLAIFYGMACSLGLIFYHDLKLKEWNKQVVSDIHNEMPVMIMSIKLLITAGMPMVKAIEVSTRNGVLFVCVGAINQRVINGSSFVKSYIYLANQMQMTSMTRFCRIVAQDEKHGSKETVVLLDKLLDDLWKERRSSYLKKGEEASTKLLLPMMMALISILIAMMVPALSQLFTVI
ncbi:hypothetical protein EZV73_09285 [Acidaminobacter sp. JC074]|uniref:type II secretion system F family protein n=1 Tax=Acidaminobacter sp. JC074 TaxID=2530199 RepID=UPI001F103E48|nr:type II secretion system F family protein [Acidaminobacter sp. JC074]MCH4887766.1 hypothetical protein [Acidaminobacter sp. JC074]